jgi:hypothetical protein
MCAAGYKRHDNGIIAQGAVWNGEDAILKGAGHSEAQKRPGRWA